jgi:CDP-glucose 4,6-dehydratase
VDNWADGAGFKVDPSAADFHEAHFLKLDCSKARMSLGWKAKWDASETIRRVCAWHKAHLDGQDMKAFVLREIEQYQKAISTN